MANVTSYLRTHRWARSGLSGLAGLFLLAAVGLLGYPIFTNLYQNHIEGDLANELASPSTRQAYLQHRVGIGQSLTRLRIPRIGTNVVVVEGTTESALRAGAGHYPETPLPCTNGNVSIAGHRTTYGKPFADVDKLRPGDPITLQTPVGSCTYTVSQPPFQVAPTDLSVVAPTMGPTLTLTSCTPKGLAINRIVVKAVMRGAPAASA
jgi:sortase A